MKRSLLRLDNLALVNGAIHHWQNDEVDLVAVAYEVRTSPAGDESFSIDPATNLRTGTGDPLQVALIVHRLPLQ